MYQEKCSSLYNDTVFSKIERIYYCLVTGLEIIITISQPSPTVVFDFEEFVKLKCLTLWEFATFFSRIYVIKQFLWSLDSWSVKTIYFLGMWEITTDISNVLWTKHLI